MSQPELTKDYLRNLLSIRQFELSERISLLFDLACFKFLNPEPSAQEKEHRKAVTEFVLNYIPGAIKGAKTPRNILLKSDIDLDIALEFAGELLDLYSIAVEKVGAWKFKGWESSESWENEQIFKFRLKLHYIEKIGCSRRRKLQFIGFLLSLLPDSTIKESVDTLTREMDFVNCPIICITKLLHT